MNKATKRALGHHSLIHWYYTVFLLSLCLLMGAFGWYFWNSGALITGQVSSVFEATTRLDEMTKRSEIAEIRTFVLSDNARDASIALDRIEKNIQFINDSLNDKFKSSTLTGEILKVKESLSGMSSLPEINTILNVFTNKVLGFSNYVEMRKWKTLSRISARIMARSTPLKNRRGPGLSAMRLREVFNAINTDFSSMISITEGSVLSLADKNIILENIKGMKTELAMFDQYVTHFNKFETHFNLLTNNFKQWTDKISPNLLLLKIGQEKKAREMVMAFVGIFSYVIVGIFGGLFIQSIHRKRTKKILEETLISSARDKILALRPTFDVVLGDDFEREFEKLRQYAQRRMGFGQVFQDATPFAAILLDSNLNLTWANPHFCEQWDIDAGTGKLETMTWDYLQQFTNLGEDDPVLQALSANVAGIFQIQVRPRRALEALPYEMYVSPVESNGKTVIMVFFYPLRSLVETMTNQTKALVGPINRSLDVLAQGQFTVEFQDRIFKDFDIAGIAEIFEKFRRFNDFVNLQRTGLMGEIATLENNLDDQYKLNEDASKEIADLKNTHQALARRFEEIKAPLVTIFDQRQEMGQIHSQTVLVLKNLLKECLQFITLVQAQNELLSENRRALDSAMVHKETLKERKQSIEEARVRFSQTIDQALIFLRSGDLNPVKLEQVLNKVKIESKAVDKAISSFSEVNTTLDVGLSKMKIVMENNSDIDLDLMKSNIDKSRGLMEGGMFNMGMAEKVSQSEEEKMVAALRHVVGHISEERYSLARIEHLMEQGQSRRLGVHSDSLRDTSSEFLDHSGV